MNYRKLTDNEIAALKKQGCFSFEWAKVEVKADGFSTDWVQNVTFVGEIRIGENGNGVEVEEGIKKMSGLYHSHIENCTIGNHVRIANVSTMANYRIRCHSVIENVGTLVTNGETTFGNGTEIDILNEAGGRELPIFDMLNSQIAYMIVNYRHDPELILALRNLIDRYVQTKKSSTGNVGKNVRIVNCNTLRNVWIEQNATVWGAQLLENGTIVSSPEAPTFVGNGVTAKNFIIHQGARVDGFAYINACFVGQATQIGKQFSAENSAIFANCEAFHGEACSVFAAPYTVTHHKSTLLIAGMFSFFNAGSASNQSNHKYKLGPVHQGFLQRGSKTGSSSYLLMPTRVGAFSVIIGKHFNSFDSSDFPFSYISEDSGKSVLTPALNLFTVGTRRDTAKWLARDRRTSTQKLDFIHFDLFNPYIMSSLVKGSEILRNIAQRSDKSKNFVGYKGVHIAQLMLTKAANYYDMAVSIYIGEEIEKRLQKLSEINKWTHMQIALLPDAEPCAQWVDMAGMLMPHCAAEHISDAIKTNDIDTIEKLYAKLEYIFESYAEFSWSWCTMLIYNKLNIEIQEITKNELVKLLSEYVANKIRLNNLILKDAQSEFDKTSRLAYGIDGDETIRNLDFEAVRGTYDTNKFVKELKAENEAVEKRVNSIIERIAMI